jgi:N4-gp56 family major capsid protein
MANTTSINNELYSQLVAAAQYAAYETSLARQVVSVFDMPKNAGLVVQVPVWAGMAAAKPGENTAPSVADTNTTSASITMAEHVVWHQVSDLMRDSSYGDMLAQIGQQSGSAIAESLDTEVFNLFNSLTTNSVGTEDSAITVDNIFEAVQKIRNAKVTGPLYGVLSPRQALQIKKALYNAGGTVATAGSFGNAILERGYIGTLAGVQLFESTLVKQDLDTDVDLELNAVGAIFAKSALGHAMRGGITVEEDRNPTTRSTDLVVSAVAGAAIIQDSHACKLVGSATD